MYAHDAHSAESETVLTIIIEARKFVVQSLELPRGIGQYAEPLLQRIARELVALTHDKQEDDATTPATWNQDDVQRRWAELRGVDYKPHQSSSSAGPPGPAPASSLAPPTVLAGGRIEVVNGTVMFRTQPKHVSSRACDLFAVDASETIRAGALSLRTTHAHADKQMSTLRKIVQWRLWKALPVATREEWTEQLNQPSQPREHSAVGSSMHFGKHLADWLLRRSHRHTCQHTGSVSKDPNWNSDSGHLVSSRLSYP